MKICKSFAEVLLGVFITSLSHLKKTLIKKYILIFIFKYFLNFDLSFYLIYKGHKR